MVLGLIWFLSHLWVVEVILASSFRKRERLWHFLRWRPLKADAAVELGKIQESPFLKRSKSLAAVKAKSLLRCRLFILSFSFSLSSSYSRSGCLPFMFSFLLLENFLFCLLSVKDCCFGRIDLLALLLFLVANSWGGEKVGRVSLSMKDCGAASRAAKSPLRLLFWKTWGIFSFQSANISALFLFWHFLNFVFPRSRLLVERQWALGSEMPSPSWNC